MMFRWPSAPRSAKAAGASAIPAAAPKRADFSLMSYSLLDALSGLGRRRWSGGLVRFGIEVAGGKAPRLHLAEGGLHLPADVHHLRAAGAEVAALRRIGG